MKKGILAGISVVVISAAFWACGSGSVEDMSGSDENALGLYGYGENAMLGLKAEALKACADDEACVAEQTGAKPIGSDDEDEGDEDEEGDSEEESSESSEPESSDSGSTGGTSSTATSGGTSSTSTTGGGTTTGGSSSSTTPSITPVTGNSSSSTATSSAGGSGSVSGSCKPTTISIEKGGSTTWTFTRTGSLSAQPTLDWTFEGGSKTSESGTASSTQTATSAITYSTAGSFGASVVLNKGKDDEKTITCSKVTVTGTKVSGCTCTADKESADLATVEDVDVTWTVKNCSGGSKFTYAWSGDATGSSSSVKKNFSTRGSYQPRITVTNEDKMTMSPTCPAFVLADNSNPENFTCSVSKTAIYLGETFTFTVDYSSNGCWSSSITGNAVSSTNCGTSYSITPTETGLLTYEYTLSGQGGKGTCIKSVSVTDNSDTWKDTTFEVTSSYQTMKMGYIYAITYTGSGGSLTCTGPGAISCNGGNMVSIGSGETKAGSKSECTSNVKVFGTLKCHSNW